MVQALPVYESRPNEVEVTFGVNSSTMVGAVIASANAAANFGVTARWAGKAEETLDGPGGSP
jgi:hypothetical protein